MKRVLIYLFYFFLLWYCPLENAHLCCREKGLIIDFYGAVYWCLYYVLFMYCMSLYWGMDVGCGAVFDEFLLLIRD